MTTEFLRNPWTGYSNEFAAYLVELCVDLSGDPEFSIQYGEKEADFSHYSNINAALFYSTNLQNVRLLGSVLQQELLHAGYASDKRLLSCHADEPDRKSQSALRALS